MKPINHIREALFRHSIKYDEGWCFFRLNQCPKKVKQNTSSVTNFANSFYISKDSGDFICLKCMKNGNFGQVIDMVKSSLVTSSATTAKRSQQNCQKAKFDLVEDFNKSIPIDQCDGLQLDRILATHSILKQISKETLIKWQVRLSQNSDCLLVPSVLNDRQTVIKATPIFDRISFDPVGIQTCLNRRQTDLILVDSIIDGICANQESMKPVLVISDLKSSTVNIPLYALVFIERFKRVYIWPTNSSLCDIELIKLAKYINSHRCLIVNPIYSPSDCLGKQLNVKEILKSSFSLVSDNIVTFANIRNQVIEEIEQNQKLKGLQWNRFRILNSILKGHRPGELTILTGDTGSGKTTFLSEYSLDLCVSHNLPTLWGSFEIHNHRLAKTMLTQFAGSFELLKDDLTRSKFADAFASLQIYFMDFYGSESIHRVTSTIASAIVTKGIKHVIIDNLQFMVGMEYKDNERFYMQDKIIQTFRRLSTVYNCHITLVIHPRKESSRNNEKLNICSIFGSAKASQEADNVIIIQSKTNKIGGDVRKYLEVVKNRFDGQLGEMELSFNQNSLSFVLDSDYTDRNRQKI